MSRHRQLMMALATLKEEDNYIHFEDDAVLQVLLANGVGDGIGVTYDDAAKVTTISTWFQNNANITAFEEFAAFSGITNLIKYTFRNCTSLQRIKLPSSINKFSADAVFEYCTALREIYLPSALTSLAAWAFNGCTSLAKVLNLGETQLTTIGDSTFRDCHLLAEITIPASLTTIESYAFSGCSALTYIKILATTPPSLSSTDTIPSTIGTIYVPDESIEAYKAATNWSSFASKIKGISEMPTE